MAVDIEHGFVNRLILAPLRRIALLGAELSGALAIGCIQAAIFFGVGYAAGASIKTGIAGAFVVVAMFLCAVLGFAAIGLLIGLWTGSPAAVAGIAPLTAVFLFLSSMSMPRNLIETNWFEKVATINPLSYLVEGLRAPMIIGWDKQAIALGFAVAGGLIVIGMAGSVWMLKRRVVAR
jgi:ABC-2 type transport system permease protein